MELILKITLILITFFLGLCFGSFINVVVYRINNNRSPLKGRSICPRCKHKLAWYDNIPLLSYILLKAKCRYCHSPISIQYPLVELATAIITTIIFLNSHSFESYSIIFHFPLSIFHLVLLYCLITVFVSDLLYYTVPTEPIIVAIVAAIINIFFKGFDIKFIYSALGAGLFFEFLHLATRKKGMGFGDVQIAFLIGLILGWPASLISIMLAFLTGAVVGVILILVGYKKLSSRIPFGPFLIFWLWILLYFSSVRVPLEKLFFFY